MVLGGAGVVHYCFPACSTTSVKLASGILAGTSPPVGHNSKPSPPQHPSHQLLDERGLKQQK